MAINKQQLELQLLYLESGSRTMSAIHKRIYSALKNEFRIMARVFKLYLPPEYPYDVVGGQRSD